METQSPTAAQRVATLRATFGIPEWQREFRLKCEPYQLRITTTHDNADLEIHFSHNDPLKFEPLINTMPIASLDARIRRFHTVWNSQRHKAEDSFRLTTTLAQVFQILIPEAFE